MEHIKNFLSVDVKERDYSKENFLEWTRWLKFLTKEASYEKVLTETYDFLEYFYMHSFFNDVNHRATRMEITQVQVYFDLLHSNEEVFIRRALGHFKSMRPPDKLEYLRVLRAATAQYFYKGKVFSEETLDKFRQKFKAL